MRGIISVKLPDVTLLGKSNQRIKSLAEMVGDGDSDSTFTVSFTEGAKPSTRMSLPPTAELLAAFGGGESNAPLPQSGEQSTVLSADAKAVLEKTLREFIGPIATMICARPAFKTTRGETSRGGP